MRTGIKGFIENRDDVHQILLFLFLIIFCLFQKQKKKERVTRQLSTPEDKGEHITIITRYECRLLIQD